MAVEACEVLAQIRQVEKPIDTAEQMIRWYVLIKVEGIKQSVLLAAVFSIMPVRSLRRSCSLRP